MRTEIEKYVKTWENRCYKELPDDAPLEIFDKVPSYKRIAMAILRNDLSLIGVEPKYSEWYGILKRIELSKNPNFMLNEKEKQQREAEKTFNRRFAGFVRSLKTDCKENGLNSMELKLEFLEAHPGTKLPKPYFDHANTVEAFKRAIQEYKESIET